MIRSSLTFRIPVRILLLGIVFMLPSCTEQPIQPTQPDRHAKTIEDLTRRLQREQTKREHETARHQAEVGMHQADFQGATIVWISTALAMVILALLLARERRARRVLERIVRMLLGRLHGSRDPPILPTEEEEP